MHCLLLSNAIERAHGGHRIATHLRELGWNCEVLDFCQVLSFEHLQEYCIQRINGKTKFIGISHVFLHWFDNLKKLLKWLKKTYPEIMIISGAQNFYLNNAPEEVDYHFTGYSEWQLEKFLKWKFSNGDPVTLTLDNVINCHNETGAAPFRDPAIKYEKRDYLKPYEWLGIEMARGCKFSCAFCDLPFLGVKGDYTRDADSVERHLKYNFDNFGIHRYRISDETFNDRTEKISKYADVVERLNFTPYFTGYIRADLLIARPRDREELERMNFVGHFYGIESFNYETTKGIKKGMHPDRMKEGLLDIINYYKGKTYRGTMSLIAGLPHETLQSLYETKQWVLENWMPNYIYSNAYFINKISDSIKGSKIDKNLSEYGYEDTKQRSPLERKSMYGHNMVGQKDADQYPHVVWKNKHMTFAQAHIYSNRFYQSAVVKGMKQCAYLTPSTITTDLPVKDLFDLPAPNALNWNKDFREKFVPTYIEKKLGNSF